MVGSYDGPWTVTIKAYGDASPVFRNNEIYGTLDGGGGGGTDYVYLARPSTTGKITFISNYMDVGVNAASSETSAVLLSKVKPMRISSETSSPPGQTARHHRSCIRSKSATTEWMPTATGR